MKISYYDADDILHIQLTGEPIETDESMAPHLHLGYSANGLAEITILDARQSDWEKLRDLLYYGAISCLGGYPDEDRSRALRARLKAHSLAQQARDRELREDPELAEVLMRLPELGDERMEEQRRGYHEASKRVSKDVAAKSALYDQDFYLWTQEQATLLRARQWPALDVKNLLEEVETLGRDQERHLRSALEKVISALLVMKLSEAQGARAIWREDATHSRCAFARGIAEMPSLKQFVPDLFSEAWLDAAVECDKTIRVLGEAAQVPEDCPFTLEQVLDYDFWPVPEPWSKGQRVGFAKGIFEVPDDFDTMNASEIAEMFEGIPVEAGEADLLTNVIEVVGAALEISDNNVDAVHRWFRSEALQSFGGKTAWELVREKRAGDVLGYLRSIEGGFVG
jgi:hypothetical protein